MDSVYDIFEIMPDGVLVWKCAVTGQDAALRELESLAMTCKNEIRVVHLSTNTVFASKPSTGKVSP